MQFPSLHLPNPQSMGISETPQTSLLMSIHRNQSLSKTEGVHEKKSHKRKKKKREKVESFEKNNRAPIGFNTSSSPSHSSTSIAVNCISVTTSETSRPFKKQKTKKANFIVQGKWPKSQNSLPQIKKHLKDALLAKSVEFKINEECTSLAISPSGSIIVGGFTDGTIRFFDLSYNKLWSRRLPRNQNNDDEETEFSDHEDKNIISKEIFGSGNRAKHKLVCSRENQEYGSVTSQIHAKGVHTALIMHVDISPDCKFAFGGVMRGSTEMVAIDISKLEKSRGKKNKNEDILDLIHVWKESDAKLRGFGACTRWESGYRLFCGRGIKNIHIWNFTPPHENTGTPTWSCIYDTQSNGNTVSFLRFRHLTSGHLQAVSKSDGQKLRLWDLSCNSKRPPYRDVPGTEDAIACSGAFSFGGTYNQMNLVHLDAEDALCSRMEIPLPSSDEGVYSRRRDRRRTLKHVVNAVSIGSGSHALLELSDGTFLHYDREKTASPLTKLPIDVFGPCTSGPEIAMNRKLAMARIGREGLLVFAVSQYNLTSNRGKISFRMLEDGTKSIGKDEFWGFSEENKSNFSFNDTIPHMPTPSPQHVTPISTVKIPDNLSISTPPFLSWSSPLSHRSVVNSSPDHTTSTNGSPPSLKKSHRSISLINSSKNSENKNQNKSNPKKQDIEKKVFSQTSFSKVVINKKRKPPELKYDNLQVKANEDPSSIKLPEKERLSEKISKTKINPGKMKDQGITLLEAEGHRKSNQLFDLQKKISNAATSLDVLKRKMKGDKKKHITKKVINDEKLVLLHKQEHCNLDKEIMRDQKTKLKKNNTTLSRKKMHFNDESKIESSKKDTRSKNKLISTKNEVKLAFDCEKNKEGKALSKEKDKMVASKTIEVDSSIPLREKSIHSKKLYHEAAYELSLGKKSSSNQPKPNHSNQTSHVTSIKMSVEADGQLQKRRLSNDGKKTDSNEQNRERKNQASIPNDRAVHDEIATALCELQRSIKGNNIENSKPRSDEFHKNTKPAVVDINVVLQNERKIYGEPPDIPLSMREGMQKELNAKNTPTIIYHDLYQGNDFHSIENYHLREREILAAKHRASHEIFRSKFLAALHWEGKHRDTNICEEEDMREDMEEIICDHEEMLEEMLDIQELEASVLLAKHRSETGRRDLTPLEVSFPFPNMFAEIRRSLGHTC